MIGHTTASNTKRLTMHDIRAIRENPAAFDAALSRRGLSAMSSDLLAMDEARRAAIHGAETAQAAQNAASKEAGAAKARGDDGEFNRLRALVTEKKAEIQRLGEEAAAAGCQARGRPDGHPQPAAGRSSHGPR